jgi:penicillin-insensitive murein DD-endopeptidase
MRRQFLYPIVALPLLAVAVAGAALAADPAVKAPAPVPAQKDAAPAPAPAPDAKPAPDAAKDAKGASDAKDTGDAKDAANTKDVDAKDKADAKDSKTAKNGKKEKKPVVLAKTLFGVVKTPSPLAARAIGFYSKGCLAGGVQLSDAGADWQTMRPSRNRAWGHPKLIALLHRLADDAKEKDGWPGLLVGDIAQPRGGPMLSGHASHQVGLDADIWLTPMPDHVLSVKEREDIQATMMVAPSRIDVDPAVFTDKQVALIKRAASYPEVERIFVNPAIKKALCKAAGNDKRWLTKVRPMGGHDYHFHIRIKCPNGGCEGQKPVDGDDGCGKELDRLLKAVEAAVKKGKEAPSVDDKFVPPSEKRHITMDQLPAECKTVLNSKAPTTIAGDEPKPEPATASAKK